MNIKREIGIYEKEGEKLITTIPLNFDESKLIELFNVDIQEDPHVFKIYPVSKEQYLELSNSFPDLLKYAFDDVEMFCESFQV